MLNRALRGWAITQCRHHRKAYRALDSYTAVRLRRGLQFKAQGQATQGRELSLSHLYGHFRLVRLARLLVGAVVGEGVTSCPRAGCGKSAMSGSMSGVWKRSQRSNQ